VQDCRGPVLVGDRAAGELNKGRGKNEIYNQMTEYPYIKRYEIPVGFEISFRYLLACSFALAIESTREKTAKKHNFLGYFEGQKKALEG